MEVEVRGSRHCGLADCNQLDFLPFTCEHCSGVFCNDHWTAAAHKCTAARIHEARAVTCPVCSGILRIKLGENPDDVLSNHIDAGCPRDQTSAAAEDARRAAPPCAAPRCTTRLTGASPMSTPTACKSCRKLFCLSHRLEPDHKCGAAVSVSPGPSIGPFRISPTPPGPPARPAPAQAPSPPAHLDQMTIPPRPEAPLRPPPQTVAAAAAPPAANAAPPAAAASPPATGPARTQFGFGGPRQAPHTRYWSNWGSQQSAASSSAGQSPFAAYRANQAQQAQQARSQQQEAEAAAAPAEARPCSLQIRLLDGRTIQQKFSSSDTLRTVRSFVASQCAAQHKQQVKLMTPFPRQTFSEDLMDLTLETADLVPSGTIIATV